MKESESSPSKAPEESLPPTTENDVQPENGKGGTSAEPEVSSAVTGVVKPPPTRLRVLKDELQQCTVDIIDPESIEVSFENFPYYLSEPTKNHLISSSYLPLKCKNNKFLSYLPIVCPRVLLSGPTGSGIYQETLAKALARFSGVKLLVVCWVLFPKVKTADSAKKDPQKEPVAEPVKEGLRTKADDNVISELVKLVLKESESGPVILFLKEGARSMTAESDEALESYKSQLERLPKNVVVILSNTTGEADPQNNTVTLNKTLDYNEVMNLLLASAVGQAKVIPKTMVKKPLKSFFPTKVAIQVPEDEAQLSEWKKKMDEDAETLNSQLNVLRVRTELDRVGILCDDLDELCIKDQVVTNEKVEKVIQWAISHHFMHSPEACESAESDEKLSISKESIQYGLTVTQGNLNAPKKEEISSEEPTKDEVTSEKSLKDVVTYNGFEKAILAEVIPPGDGGVSFEDVGSLENAKETLNELVMLPLKRPELFSKGQLAKPCKGILLFGPPGTGKTMLAKAVATEAGANFINISMSAINSRWHGENEKYVKAIFTLASKIAPSIVFIDEIDSLLGRRKDNESDVVRKMKNEFMVHWDGLRTSDTERVLVLGATNRPFDLDEAVLRRLPRRLMINLPDAPNREKILKVMLSKEELSPNVKMDAIASMTEGYSGSDLKNLCVTAAHCPIRELLEKEKKEKALALSENRAAPPLYTSSDVRPLAMEDFKHASEQVSASVLSSSESMNELLEWNQQYGEGGSRKKNIKPLSYYI